MNSFARTLNPATVIVACLLLAPVHATPIAGEISIGGGVKLNNADLSLATGALAGTGMVFSGEGDFAGTEGSTVNYAAFAWNPSNAPINPLWSFTYSAKSYSFGLSSLSVVTQTTFDLILSGFGTLHIDGMDDTSGQWRYTINNASGDPHGNFRFGFSSGTSAAVPETGTTAVLVGLGLLMAGACAHRRNPGCA